MHVAIIFRILGVLLMLFSLTHLIPLAVSMLFQDGAHSSFIYAFLFTFAAGLTIWVPVYKAQAELRTRDGFLITALFWLVLGVFGAVPFLFDASLDLTAVDAVFESLSGLTTTGATVLTGLDQLPQSILFYRQQLQWLGGIGIIVIAVAILPMLGIGGMQLYRAETPGPVKDSKMTPRITETAKWLFIIYSALTMICAFSYWLAGMSVFDAICHSFSTLAIGGFSTHDASMGYFDSPLIYAVASFFMFVAGINFALHFMTWQKGIMWQYLRDSEAKFYAAFILTMIIIVLIAGWFYGLDQQLNYFWAEGVFQVVSMATTTGFTTTDFASWPSFMPILLVLLSLVGGCAGSTGGGIKVIRVLLIVKQWLRELRHLIHPNAVIPLKLSKRKVPAPVLSAVWSFFAIYIVVFFALFMLLMMTGLDFLTAYSASLAMLNNLGPGLGTVASHYGDVSTAAKWVMCLAMLLGRLEIFTLLVLFTPAFWRR